MRIWLLTALIIALELNTVVYAQLSKRVSVINSDKGLSQNSVYAVFKDSKGFIWIGTGDGINRFDGKEFVIFKNSLENKNSLDGFIIGERILEDENRCLWFSTEINLVSYDPVKKRFSALIPFANAHNQGGKRVISIDTSKKLIWFLASQICLYNYNYATGKFARFDFPFKNQEVNPFINPEGIDDENGHIWITSSNGLYKFDKLKQSWTHEVVGHEFLKGCMDGLEDCGC